ncbi:DUF1741-domain-containing protein [Laetiporus sulphureus 93-53]|uniref:DUF1741-domain-containing protein n=1 Tax=Laetiporus sulphureus 93-53 TaxID=1314785 RepID=A0A165C9P5_9APHY|nr:DUF1741-domain-containing protein [Laetiporus sulphureus 93-53]KZT02439.1 DUF1741-domain-containing protein [Laetiporus sulphureus 93-53]
MSLLSLQRDASLTSKFISTYTKLFSGLTPEQIAPNQDDAKFWSSLLELGVDADFLILKLNEVNKEDCLGALKPILNRLVLACIRHARTGADNDAKKTHAVETLSILSRCILRKNLAGWEVMEIFAGGVNESDKVFDELTSMIDEIMGDGFAPVSLKHQVLQLAVIFVSGISQLSPGAYFLRRDLFPCIVTIITSQETEQYTFEAALLLSLLANFHKSDAAKLNPYLRCIRETDNHELMHKICWASNFAADAVVKTYQSISDDSPPTLQSTFGSWLYALRPDRALAATPVDPPKELFKDQPIEACVILLPIFEFLSVNSTFHTVFTEPLRNESLEEHSSAGTKVAPLPYTLLTLFSYLLTHASSTHSSRAIAYANLALSILLVMAESRVVLQTLCEAKEADVRLCQQRLPLLPATPPRAPICALLDCCVLWLRHNLHKRLEVYAYVKCVRICHRVLWYLQNQRTRLEYHWQELWKALVGLLDFLANKLDSLITTGGIEQLVHETLLLIDLALCRSSGYLPTPAAIHELVYEVVHSAPTFRKQQTLLDKLALPKSITRARLAAESPATEALTNILSVTDHYEGKVTMAGAASARSALRVVAKEIEKDGLIYRTDLHKEEPIKQSEDVVGFIRYAYMDGLALMP